MKNDNFSNQKNKKSSTVKSSPHTHTHTGRREGLVSRPKGVSKEAPQTKDWHYGAPPKDVSKKKGCVPDTKNRRYGRCEERQKVASKDAGLRTKEDMYSTATIYVCMKFLCHTTKVLSGKVCILRKQERNNLYGKILYREKF